MRSKLTITCAGTPLRIVDCHIFTFSQSRHDSLLKEFQELRDITINVGWNYCPDKSTDFENIPTMNANLMESENQIGTYLVKETLGGGDYCTVRAGFKNRESSKNSLATGAAVAVKSVKKNTVSSIDGILQVENEIRALRLLSASSASAPVGASQLRESRGSANVIRIYEVMHGPTCLHIVMECIPTDLYDFMKRFRTRINAQVAGIIVRDILSGLMHLQLCGIAHRDLKPENILIAVGRDDMQVPEEDNPGSVQTAMLSSNGVGSPGFFAPEVILMCKYCGYKADLFSVGCIALELLLRPSFFSKVWLPPYHSLQTENAPNFSGMLRGAISAVLAEIVRIHSDQVHKLCHALLPMQPNCRISAPNACRLPWLAQADRFKAIDCLNSRNERRTVYVPTGANNKDFPIPSTIYVPQHSPASPASPASSSRRSSQNQSPVESVSKSSTSITSPCTVPPSSPESYIRKSKASNDNKIDTGNANSPTNVSDSDWGFYPATTPAGMRNECSLRLDLDSRGSGAPTLATNTPATSNRQGRTSILSLTYQGRKEQDSTPSETHNFSQLLQDRQRKRGRPSGGNSTNVPAPSTPPVVPPAPAVTSSPTRIPTSLHSELNSTESSNPTGKSSNDTEPGHNADDIHYSTPGTVHIEDLSVDEVEGLLKQRCNEAGVTVTESNTEAGASENINSLVRANIQVHSTDTASADKELQREHTNTNNSHRSSTKANPPFGARISSILRRHQRDHQPDDRDCRRVSPVINKENEAMTENLQEFTSGGHITEADATACRSNDLSSSDGGCSALDNQQTILEKSIDKSLNEVHMALDDVLDGSYRDSIDTDNTCADDENYSGNAEKNPSHEHSVQKSDDDWDAKRSVRFNLRTRRGSCTMLPADPSRKKVTQWSASIQHANSKSLTRRVVVDKFRGGINRQHFHQNSPTEDPAAATARGSKMKSYLTWQRNQYQTPKPAGSTNTAFNPYLHTVPHNEIHTITAGMLSSTARGSSRKIVI
eukprot:GSChrysophyteH1.ASY1.ANO1.1207.1 assembled CDS